MPTIRIRTFIKADRSICFDLARDVTIHTLTTGNTNERAVAGVTHGLLELHDTVTWEATHLGVKQRLTAQIVDLNVPAEFTDVMVNGAFHSFTHVHQFHEVSGGTMMTDTFTYKAPLGFLGHIANFLFLKAYMTRFLKQRTQELKHLAETQK
ncbi:ligand-binding SRPBCC domain-containing protein [Alkalihalobacillus xiaoxiensis]|uniref:Ligand-binding SRPBCC domain-containing protein n=1 Tax=Shouchella xiaoxiensis TaxID=766895 RepID=A0ABS2SUW0_9BACI|nr:SRPBCC family protein [Shouchella xiaoxiensis]MBM7839314.1 ligand-binding SRPBCC domain-containing protein [Shouchella xiaoxiensis]